MAAPIALTLKPDQPVDIGGKLTLLVTELADKWLSPDRAPIPKATILLVTRHRQQLIELTTHDPKASWRPYEFWYLGRSRSEVRVSIKRT